MSPDAHLIGIVFASGPAHVNREVIEHERRTGDGVDRALTRKLGERGWIASGWPVDEGGAGLDPFEAAALWNALRKGGVPTAGPGTTMLPANAIRATGSAELKNRVLPGVAAGEVLICLGYTEPAGGSDVFACATRSQRDGDEWIVNGQKIFTTFAHLADYCFLGQWRHQGQLYGFSGVSLEMAEIRNQSTRHEARRNLLGNAYQEECLIQETTSSPSTVNRFERW